jgi:DtxR family Mn-dependent transcriptional regulator
VLRENLTDAVEDYLKTIYEITLAEGRASTNQIAAALGVAPASVTGMLKRLAASQPPLLEYRKHHGVALTPAGEKAALEVIRHHRLLEQYLHQALGYPWDEVHAEADRLEHVISEDFEERIAQALGHPAQDPHGDPIPSRELTMPSLQATRLDELRQGQRAAVRRVRNDDPGLLRYLQGIGLIPQAMLDVLDYSCYDGNLRLRIGENEVTLGPAVTRQIFVEVL